jgi:hypothetical protein
VGEVDALGEQLEARKFIARAQGQLIDQHGLSEQGPTDGPRSAKRPTSPTSGTASRTSVRELTKPGASGRGTAMGEMATTRECSRQRLDQIAVPASSRRATAEALIVVRALPWRMLVVRGTRILLASEHLSPEGSLANCSSGHGRLSA